MEESLANAKASTRVHVWIHLAKSGADQRKELNIEKYIQRVTTLSLTIRVYLHSFSRRCLPNLRHHAKFWGKSKL